LLDCGRFFTNFRWILLFQVVYGVNVIKCGWTASNRDRRAERSSTVDRCWRQVEVRAFWDRDKSPRGAVLLTCFRC
jgi:hypothetical protein